MKKSQNAFIRVLLADRYFEDVKDLANDFYLDITSHSQFYHRIFYTDNKKVQIVNLPYNCLEVG